MKLLETFLIYPNYHHNLINIIVYNLYIKMRKYSFPHVQNLISSEAF